MARKSIEMKRLEAREAELIARLKSDQAELQEVLVAKRVLTRLSGDESGPEPSSSTTFVFDANALLQGMEALTPEDREGATIGEMAYDLLKLAGPRGLTSNEILELIRADSMPELARTSLSPPLSRLKKRGMIDLVGDRWKVTSSNEGST
jgi:hypothetical protein